ncbi:hypothetical protein ACFPES_13430 [Paenibacillus sp. GCM10023248]|uniref:hypothetical protein n=1 Tax=Bacillales TaxID=1385 RepID=UPI002378D6C8|nr:MULTISPECIES: hypothetical protein [Bacillales]MDD9268034.1 hypothetical protein [Paenibacillus sp. MAHUQ-63]MDR6879707.1 putative membrane protein [Bacillus sp. 3255]
MKLNYYTLSLGLLGAAKLILDAYGVNIIEDDDINAIANGVAALLSVVGIYTNHQKS